VFGDRMWDSDDVAWLVQQLDDRLSTLFTTSISGLFDEFGGQVCDNNNNNNNNNNHHCAVHPAISILWC
jgi:hypothetical protein